MSNVDLLFFFLLLRLLCRGYAWLFAHCVRRGWYSLLYDLVELLMSHGSLHLVFIWLIHVRPDARRVARAGCSVKLVPFSRLRLNPDKLARFLRRSSELGFRVSYQFVCLVIIPFVIIYGLRSTFIITQEERRDRGG